MAVASPSVSGARSVSHVRAVLRSSPSGGRPSPGRGRRLGHDYIGTEHILLGLIHEGKGTAAGALESLGISLEAVRAQVEEIIGQGRWPPSGDIPFTPRAKMVMELSKREALQLGHDYVGTEHILFALIREGEGVAAQVLVKLGVDPIRVRQRVIQQLSVHTHGDEITTTAGREETLDERGERPDEELIAHAPFASSDQIDEIRALLLDIVERLARIERHVSEGEDTP